MIGISTQTYDLNGARIFKVDLSSELANRKGSRRVERTATLDGGVAIYDTGYSESDRDILIEVPGATPADIDFARYIVENYGLVNITTLDGSYSGVPESYGVDDGTLKIKILVSNKIDELPISASSVPIILPAWSEDDVCTGSSYCQETGGGDFPVTGWLTAPEMRTGADVRWAVVTWDMQITALPSSGYCNFFFGTAGSSGYFVGRLDSTGWHPNDTSPTTITDAIYGVPGLWNGGDVYPYAYNCQGSNFKLTLSGIHLYQTATEKITY
jgi:hypothetical protein